MKKSRLCDQWWGMNPIGDLQCAREDKGLSFVIELLWIHAFASILQWCTSGVVSVFKFAPTCVLSTRQNHHLPDVNFVMFCPLLWCLLSMLFLDQHAKTSTSLLTRIGSWSVFRFLQHKRFRLLHHKALFICATTASLSRCGDS